MTGIRSWTAEVTAFGVVVRTAHVFTQLPLGSFQRSHIPANANNSPSLTSKAVWLLQPEWSFAQDGMSPHRINDSSRTGSFGFWRMTATGWVGAML